MKTALRLRPQELARDTADYLLRNLGRHVTLEELTDTQVDMFSTVFIGNEQTKVIEGKMVTPRGYRHE